MTLRLMENPEVALAVGYAPIGLRPMLAAILALDDALGAVLRATGQPVLAQMRLAWWREQLTALDGDMAPAMPVLVEVQRNVVARGVPGAVLAEMATGWERLATAETLDDALLAALADERGGTVFRAVAMAAGVGEPSGLAAAGRGWALADIARHLSERDAAERARAMAIARLSEGPGRWPRGLRSLGALALLARMDAAVPLDQPVPHGAPGRVMRMAALRITGR